MANDPQRSDSDTNVELPSPQGRSIVRTYGIAALGVALKLFKTAKVVKVALAGMAVASYGIIFSWQFAFVLIGIFVFHEYGHLRAMKRFSLKTKGMYLIPFVGGVAIGQRPSSQWQVAYIAMMGPIYGLLMTAVFFAIYLATGSHFAGLVATFSGFINLLNLLPIYPLDGGQVLKSMVVSLNYRYGVGFLLLFSALSFALSASVGFYFLSFFVFLGAVDLAASWGRHQASLQVPMRAYGIAFTAAWYLVVVAAFVGIIIIIARAKVPGSELIVKILSS